MAKKTFPSTGVLFTTFGNMSITKKSLGDAIHSVRITRGLTQKDLASAIKMAQGFVSLIEQGKRSLSVGTLDKIAKALEIPTGCLLIMASSNSMRNKSAEKFKQSLQRLIATIIQAQVELKNGT